MPQSIAQYRGAIGNHVNWSDKQQDNPQKHNERIQQLVAQPGNHAGNRGRQQVACAAVQLLSVLSSVQNTHTSPAITSRRADKLATEERIAHANNLYRGKMVERAINREVMRNSGQNLRAENAPKTQDGSSEQRGAAFLRAGSSDYQVRPANGPLSTTHPKLVSDKVIPPSVSGNAGHPANDGSSFRAMLSPVANALYETGQFIARHDPLRFPGADAAALPSVGTDSTMATDIAKNIKNGSYLSGDLTGKTMEIIKTIKNNEDRIAINNVIKKLNSIAIEAKKKHPSGSAGERNIDLLIYLIDHSSSIISDFEIKYSQDSICNNFRIQLEDYIKIASGLSDNESALKFKRYNEEIPSLKLTPDSRGEGYPSVESQIAGNLVRSVYWFQNDEGYSAAYGLRYDAHKALLTSLLAEKKLGDVKKLPDNWYKGDEALRLFNILFRDLKHNLKNKGEGYIFRSARLFYSSLREAYTGDSVLDIKGLDKKSLSSYSDKDKLLALKHYFNKPVQIEYNQETNAQRFLKIIDFIFTIQSISELVRPRSFLGGGRHHHGHRKNVGAPITYGNLSRGKAKNFKLNKTNNQITIEITHGTGLKRQQKINRKNRRIISNNEKISTIKFKSRPGLGGQKPKIHLSKEVRNKITPDMYEKNIDAKKLTPPNDMGLMSDQNGKKYIKINKSYVRIKQRDGNIFFSKKNGGVVHLEYRDGKIHLESSNKRLARIKNSGLSGRKTTPGQLIASKLNISKEKAEEILSKYEFPDGSQLYTKETFALSLRDTGSIPEWAKSFKKIDVDNYASPFKGSNMMDNGLKGFHGKDGYFYRVDNNPPETVLKNGFKTSEDYTAIPKMLPEDMDGVIVSETLEGAQRYQTINKNSYIYRVNGENIEGVSLKDNLYKNEKGLNDFLGEPLAKKHSTLESLAEDTNGAIHLDEVHLRKKTITPDAISVLPAHEANEALSSGPWQKYL